ncbi:tetratricopeptide repeat protein [Persephonella sp.]|uniref:tetratricopeptide repeat protein n=2 Tax=Persephonella sp. TaxID=2060922 RepID=UPI0025F1DFF1|nr:tetratricopeptide repeat protein [Persephonella sp.]
MSKTGKFLQDQEEFDIQQEQADIHPFSQVKPQKRRKYIIIFLFLLTVVVYSGIGYLIFRDQSKNDTSPEVSKNETKTEQLSEKLSNKISIPHFDIKLSGIEEAVRNSIKHFDITEVSYFKKKENKLARYKYYMLKAKENEIKGRYIDAISFYKKAWEINKKNPEILYRLSLLHFKIGYYKGAEKYVKQFLKIQKKDLKGLLLLSKSYEKMGNLKKAKIVLEEAYFLYPENKDVLENLGKLYEKENALIVAKDIYKILSDMGYLEGKLGLARVYEKLNDKKSALKIYREIYQDPNIPENLRTKIENKIISLE